MASTSGPITLTRTKRPETGTEFVAPRSRAESAVAEILAETLGLERLGAHDGMFAFGGDSETATAVAARLSDVYPVAVTLADVMTSPATPSGISDRLTSLLTDAVENMSEDEVRADAFHAHGSGLNAGRGADDGVAEIAAPHVWVRAYLIHRLRGRIRATERGAQSSVRGCAYPAHRGGNCRSRCERLRQQPVTHARWVPEVRLPMCWRPHPTPG
jgi:hypothetical protein